MPTTTKATTRDNLSPANLMREIQAGYPGAQRTLFRHYHIGGCKSCAFSPDETLEDLCRRNSIEDAVSVLNQIRDSHEEDAALFITPEELRNLLDSGDEVKLLDIRTREEFDAVSIRGSILMSQPVMQDIMAYWNPDSPLIIIDHTGEQCLDAAAYFSGHGIRNVRCLQGGIDAWASSVDPDMPRYVIN